MHLWHDITPGPGAPQQVTAVIEIPRGSRTKYEIHKESGLLCVDRVLHGSMHYPIHYGIVPQTLFLDGDPLDILVYSQAKLVPGCLVEARIIGVMEMIDNGEQDDKIIAVLMGDMHVAHIHDLSELSEHFFAEVRDFFESYKRLEAKEVSVPQFLGKERAWQIVEESQQRYKELVAVPA